MTTRPKFDPSRVANLLNRGAEEGRGPLSPAPAPAPTSAPVLASVPAPTPEGPASGGALELEVAETAAEPSPAGQARRVRRTPEPEPADASIKRPLTVRLTEDVIHALVRYQAEVRCKPGVRLGDTTIGGVIDKLLRGPLGLPS